MKFNFLESKRFIHVLSVVFILILVNSIKDNFALSKTLTGGEEKVLSFSTLEQAKCNLRKVANRHLKLKDDNGKLYSVLINKIRCRNYEEDKIIVKCNGFDCVDSGYEVNYILYYIKFIGVVLLIVVNLLLFFNKMKL